MKFAIVLITGFGIDKLVDTIRGVFKSNTLMWGANFFNASVIPSSKDSVALS